MYTRTGYTILLLNHIDFLITDMPQHGIKITVQAPKKMYPLS